MPPKISENQPKPDVEIDLRNSLTILISKDNKLFWHQQEEKSLNASNLNETDYSKVRDVITNAQKGAKDIKMFTVIIKPMDDATYDNLVTILDEMEITKSTKYGIVPVAPFEQKVYEEKVGK